MASSGRPLGVAVRRWWEDRRPEPLGDGWCAKVVVTDGSVDYTPQSPVYVLRGMRAREGFEAALEEELELLAEDEWSSETQAKELASAVEEDRLVSLLEDFGLGNDRS